MVAHVTADRPALTEDGLRRWSAEALPAFMVPGRVVFHDRLPLTATGKLDRRSLKETAMAIPSSAPRAAATIRPADDSASGTPYAEDVLTRAVADLLGVRVRPEDNFFELGGDSVLGVRVAARAARSGVHFTPQQILQHHSLRDLAAATTVTTGVVPENGGLAAAAPAVTPPSARAAVAMAGPDRRPVPLTPIMRTFLDRMPPGAPDFADAHLLEVTVRIDAESARAAIGHLLARHEPLRYRFRHNSLGWRIDCAEPDAVDVFDVQVLPPMDDAAERDFLAADIAQLRTLIDLERGPALRVRYYDRGHGRNAWIVFLVHHFVFDNMATVVLIDELDAALAELLAGRPLPVPTPVLTWPQWSRHLTDMASSDALAGELAYWTSTLRSGAVLIDGKPPEFGTAGSRPAGGVVHRVLEADQVADVLRGGPDADPAAMCAFACALARWRGTDGASVMTEGRATPTVFRPAGRSPAIGWFTTLHPLTLPVDPAADVRACLPAVTDVVRSVPNDGVGYGMLRHLSPASAAVDRLRALPEPQALVIHGTHDGSGFDAGIRLLRNRRDLASRPRRLLPAGFPLVLTTAITDGTLQLVLLYDDSHSEREAEELAEETVRAFAELAR